MSSFSQNSIHFLRKILSFLYHRYCFFDLRALALFRISIGCILLTDVLTRFFHYKEFYTNNGVFPNHYKLFSSVDYAFSFLDAFSSPNEVILFFLFSTILFALFTCGIGGVWIKVLTLLCSVSINNRNLLLENGGTIVLHLILLWTILLPTDKRFTFSLPMFLNKPLVKRKEDLSDSLGSSIAFAGCLVSIAVIYTFNFLTKTGVTWQTGTALYYSLWIPDRVTFIGVLIRDYVSFSLLQILSRTVLILEGALPILILFPFYSFIFRLIGACVILFLHFGIGLCLILGPFSPVMMSLSILVVPNYFWALIFNDKKIQSSDINRVEKNNSSKIAHIVTGILSVMIISHVFIHSLYSYKSWMSGGREPSWSLPQYNQFLIQYLRIPQHWRMFSFDAPTTVYMYVRLGRAKNSSIWIDLDKGSEFNSDKLESYFAMPSDYSYLRSEWNSRFPGYAPGDFIDHTFSYLKKTYPLMAEFKLLRLTRQSPEPSANGTAAQSIVISEQVLGTIVR
jgi:hypothetical protein